MFNCVEDYLRGTLIPHKADVQTDYNWHFSTHYWTWLKQCYNSLSRHLIYFHILLAFTRIMIYISFNPINCENNPFQPTTPTLLTIFTHIIQTTVVFATKRSHQQNQSNKHTHTQTLTCPPVQWCTLQNPLNIRHSRWHFGVILSKLYESFSLFYTFDCHLNFVVRIYFWNCSPETRLWPL